MNQQIHWFGWRPDKPDYNDKPFKPTLVKTKPAAFLDEQYVPPVRNQGELGSCTGFSTTSAVDFILAKGGEPVVSSALFAYYTGREIEGTISDDTGCEIRDVIKGIHRRGVCTEDRWPYNVKLFASRPSDAAYAEALGDRLEGYYRIYMSRLRSVKLAIMRGNPVVFGFSVYESFDDDSCTKQGLMPMPRGEMVGGHAVWIVGYDDSKDVLGRKGAVKIQNSWDTDWGDKGFFWMSYAYLADADLCDDLWVIKGVS